MERANLAVAEYLAEHGRTVHLVGHSIDPTLIQHPTVFFHEVRRPLGSFLLGERRLNREGRRVAAKVTAEDRSSRVIVNGGNCDWGDINWVHYVHHAWSPDRLAAPWYVKLKYRLSGWKARRDEARVIPEARVTIVNSELTARQVSALPGVSADRIRTIYLGAPTGWQPPTEAERAEARRALDLPDGRPVALFVGALGYDQRKGIDTLIGAWSRLEAEGRWNAELVVAGGGRGADRLKGESPDSIRWMGHTDQIQSLLAAADLLVSPVRYEAYGLNVQEALCRGLPAIVSRRAGIAERFPAELGPLLLDDPDDPDELAALLAMWRSDVPGWRERAAALGAELRRRDWQAMAAEFVEAAEATPPSS